MASIVDQLFIDAAMPLITELDGVAVSFTRGTNPPTTGIIAIADDVEYPLKQGPQGVLESATARHYSLPVATTKVNGTAVKPHAGDLITETINGTTQVYEVLADKKIDVAVLNPVGTHWLLRTKKVS